MKQLLFGLIFIGVIELQAQNHCGYDFTSYLVISAHEAGKAENVPNLKVTLVDSIGNPVINVNNQFSWKNRDKALQFTFNYKINSQGQPIPQSETGKWFYYFAKDNYLLSVTSTFQPEKFLVKIEDIDGSENGGTFQTVTVPLSSFDLYILCSSEAQNQAIKFGRKGNRPVDVVLEKSP